MNEVGEAATPVLRSSRVMPFSPNLRSSLPRRLTRATATSVSRAASPVAPGSCSTGPATTTLPVDCSTTPRASSAVRPPTATLTVAIPSPEKLLSKEPFLRRRAIAIAWSPDRVTNPAP